MLIEAYFQQIHDFIEASESVDSFKINFEKRGRYEGLIRGQINFQDTSILHFREFLYLEMTIDRKMYSYQYMNSDKILIFRYDNTEHHRKLNLPNFPDHKHDGSEENVVNSEAPFLADVLKEIEIILE